MSINVIGIDYVICPECKDKISYADFEFEMCIKHRGGVTTPQNTFYIWTCKLCGDLFEMTIIEFAKIIRQGVKMSW